MIFRFKLSRLFFFKYYGIPVDKDIFRITKTSIHYWEDREKGIAKCREFGQPLLNLPVIKKLKYVCLIGLMFLKNPIGFIFFLTTDTTSTNNGDTDQHSYSGMQDTNYSTIDFACGGYATNNIDHAMIKWTLSSGSGTISDVIMYVRRSGMVGSTAFNVEAHQITQASWSPSTSTWNKYDGTNNWSTPGGDFSATIIDQNAAVGSAGDWVHWHLMGSGSINPLTLNWGDTVSICLKASNEGNLSTIAQYNMLEDADSAKRPYLEITYTAATFIPKIIIF